MVKISKQYTNRESQSLDKYLQEIGKVELLTPQEEIDLARKIKKGDQKSLEKLTLPQAAPISTEPAKATEPAVDESRLAALARAAEPAPSANKPATTAEEKSGDLSKADEKLSSLLGKKP